MRSAFRTLGFAAFLAGLAWNNPATAQQPAPTTTSATRSAAEDAVVQAWAAAQTSALAQTSGTVQNWTRGPGTLLQWSYGNSFAGGPDLSEPLVTDRPDFTEASSTVGMGVVQVEMGYTFTKDSVDDLRAHSWGEPLFRVGAFADWFELRMAAFPVTQRAAGNTTRGFEDLYLGAKIGLTPQEGILPEIAIMPQANIPSGGNAFTGDEFQPGVNMLYSWSLCEDMDLAGSTQFNRTGDGTGHAYTEWAQSLAVGLSLAENVGAYNEFYAFFPTSAEAARPEYYYNGGFTYLVSNDVQWDIRVGMGLNDAADDFFFGTGLSVRLR